MSEGLAFTLLLLAFAGWLVLPLLPALRELLHPTDATPLAMVGQDAGELTYFADRFRAYLDEQLARGAPPSGARAGILPDGTPWLAAGAGDGAGDRAPVGDASTRNRPRPQVDALVLADAGARLPARAIYTREVFARGDVSCGERTVLRAVLADGACELGAGSDVLRWVHAEGVLCVRRHGTLHGRGTSTEAIELATGVRFARLRAPRIATDDDAPAHDAPAHDVSARPADAALLDFTPVGAVPLGDGYLRVDGSLVIPPRSRVAAHLVVRGDVHVGDGTRLEGAVKAHGSIALGRDVTARSALVARRAVHAGVGASLAGPVIAEEGVHVGAQARIGTMERPTTVVAPLVRLAPRVTVHGAITAADGLVEWVPDDGPGVRVA